MLSYAVLKIFENCVGWSRPVFWSYKGFKCILRFSETIFGIRRKTESDEHKISIRFFSWNGLDPNYGPFYGSVSSLLIQSPIYMTKTEKLG